MSSSSLHPPDGDRNAQAGSQRRSPLPSVTHDESISTAVESSLNRRRKNSFFSSLRSSKRPAARPRSVRAQGDEGEWEEDQDVSDRLDRTATLEAERIPQAFRERINMFDGEDVIKLDGDWCDAPLAYPDTKPGYVWDVLFENQRGIHLLGKAYFSSRTLLPADPSPFTLPSRSIPSASSFTVAEPASQSSDGLRTHQHTSSGKVEGKRAIRTVYNLDTFQTPSPAWNWITPWMINMKNGTDESGWRYNVWFRKPGWRSHAGPLGANGYVRRREWVRLRCLLPESLGVKEVVHQSEQMPVLCELNKAWEESSDLGGVIRVLSGIPLDRIKLEELEGWLKSMQTPREAKFLQRLCAVLEDENELHRLSQAFVHPSSVPRCLALLRRWGVNLPESSQASFPAHDIVTFPARDHSTSTSPESSTSQGSAPQTPDLMSPSPPRSPGSHSPRTNKREVSVTLETDD